jgi:hypothetical protein
MKKNYKMKKTISMKQFISEFGGDFSDHLKERLLELEVGCVLTRREDSNKLDIKHVEHLQYDCSGNSEDATGKCKKEFTYGQFLVFDEELYFSDKCIESDEVMQAPIVDTIYSSLESKEEIFDTGDKAKKIDDSNIDYVINTILTVFPKASQSYLDIISRYR